MTDSGYFVGQVADLLGGGKKKKKSENTLPKNDKLIKLFEVKSNNNESPTSKHNKSKHPKKLKSSKTDSVSRPESKISQPHVTQNEPKLAEKHNKKKKKTKVTESPPKTGDTKKKKHKVAELPTETHDAKKKKLKVEDPTSETKKKKKNVCSEKSDAKKSSKQDGFRPPKGIVHESLIEDKKQKTSKRKREEDSGEENDEVQNKRRKKHKRDKTKDRRTVFVGNLPLDGKKSTVKALFAEFGKIESLRYRCPPVSDPKVSKRVTAIKKEFHPDRSSIVSFVCFEEPEAAVKALKLNGHNLNGFHLRVDLASNEKKHNKANSVFIGNLPFDVEENVVWEHFEPCGVIENIRIVRDRKTGMGKGFGYILFQDKSSIDLAQKLNGSKLKTRVIRVDKCVESKKIAKHKNHPARQRLIKKNKKLGTKPSNMRAGETRKPKSWKKQDKAKKSRSKDAVDKIFAAPHSMPGFDSAALRPMAGSNMHKKFQSSAPRPMQKSNKHVKFD